MADKKNGSFFEREIDKVEAELAVPEAQVRGEQRADLIEFFARNIPRGSGNARGQIPDRVQAARRRSLPVLSRQSSAPS